MSQRKAVLVSNRVRLAASFKLRTRNTLAAMKCSHYSDKLDLLAGEKLSRRAGR